MVSIATKRRLGEVEDVESSINKRRASGDGAHLQVALSLLLERKDKYLDGDDADDEESISSDEECYMTLPPPYPYSATSEVLEIHNANSISDLGDNDASSIITDPDEKGFLPPGLASVQQSHQKSSSAELDDNVADEKGEEQKGVRDISVPPSIRYLPPGVLPVLIHNSESEDDDTENSSEYSYNSSDEYLSADSAALNFD